MWLCLLCGHCGCFEKQAVAKSVELGDFGRLDGVTVKMTGHAYQHYTDTKHVYCQNLDTKDVWDFSKEDFVERLLHNQVDGKLVEYSSPVQDAESKSLSSITAFNHKLAALNKEYSTTLASTLESQRLFFDQEHRNLLMNKEQQLSLLEQEV
jgi:BRCA1-associated protein